MPEGHLRDPIHGDVLPRLGPRPRLARFPEAVPVARSLGAGDPRPLADLLGRLDPEPERTIPLVAALVAEADGPGLPAVLDRWVVAAPDSWHPRYVRAMTLLGGARSARPAGAAAPDGAVLAGLRQAEAELAGLVRRHADRVELWCGLLATGGDLRVPVEERVARYEEVHRLRPFLPAGVFEAIVGLGQRNLGDSEEIFGLARAVLEQVPGHHPALAATALAHLEATSTAEASDRDEYFRRPDVLADLDAAFARWWDGSANVADADDLLAANAFAVAYVRAGRNDEVRACLRKVDDDVAPALWVGFTLGPEDMFQLVRWRLGLLEAAPRVAFAGTVSDPGPARLRGR
ncbi:MAG: hypothetical protein MUE34_05690 [Acidimicrobiales bacterium]|nr:hypothetical protein [Acidimicrobiales bacterium]